MTPQQLDELRTDEGTRLLAYDDATGKPIVPGTHVLGHPTIGIGRALDVHGIDTEEALHLLQNDVARIETALGALDWYHRLNPVRRGVMTNLAFNMGVGGLESFTRMLSEIRASDFEAAARELANSRWATQVQATRRDRLIRQFQTGAL